MKKYLLILGLIMPIFATAQTPLKIEEKFDGSAQLEWHEYADKKSSATVQDGAMVLQPKKKAAAAWTETTLPVDMDYDFTVDTEFFVPKFSNNLSIIGITFNSTVVQIIPNYATIISPKQAGSTSDGIKARENAFFSKDNLSTKTQKIKLSAGKNKTIMVGIKRTSTNCVVTINNMQVAEINMDYAQPSPILGYFSATPAHIKSVTIEQN